MKNTKAFLSRVGFALAALAVVTTSASARDAVLAAAQARIKDTGKKLDDTVLESSAPATRHRIDIHPLTAQTATPEEWLARLDQQIASVNAVDLEGTRREHRDWWKRFWQRSWLFVTAGERAKETTQGYILQRFLNACSSRGDFPIKFNGSIWVVDHPGNDAGKAAKDLSPPTIANGAINIGSRTPGPCIGR